MSTDDDDDISGIIKLADFQKKPIKDVTEDTAARAFTERYRNLLRFDHDAGKWFVWTGTHWQRERTALAFCWARELARELVRTEPKKVRLIASKANFAASVERFARADRAFAVTSEIWDRDAYLLGTTGGVVNLRTGELRAATPEDFISKRTAVTPSDKAECPRWRQFMQEVTNGDDDLVAFLHQFLGYMLTGDIKEHSLLFIFGEGGNGKTVLLNTCSGILGDYAKTASMDTFVASSLDKHPTDLAMLHGARMVVASETEEGRAWAESRIKQLTGGDKIAARFMRMDFFEFVPVFKLLLIGNFRPTLRNVDDAMRRRFNIVPFVHRPPEPDKNLEAKLGAEWPGILRWLIEGCLIWQRDGLVRPQCVLDTTAEYFTEQDVVRQWVDERCITKPTAWDTSTNLFRSWTTWAGNNGEHPGTGRWFAKTLARQGFQAHRKPGARGFKGIEAKPEEASRHWTDRD